jgi:small-conductance mechanosensitive channel
MLLMWFVLSAAQALPAHAGAGDAAAPPAQQQPQTQPAQQPPPDQAAPQPTPPAPPPPPALTPSEQAEMDALKAPAVQLTSDIEALEKSVDRNKNDDDALARNRSEIDALMERGREALRGLKPRLDAINGQIERLGPPPAKDAAPESQELAAGRARLNAIAAEIAGALKTTDLANVRARQLQSTVQSLRQSLFATQVLKRSSSPLSLATWDQIRRDIPWASTQIADLARDWFDAVSKKWAQFLALVAAVLIVYLSLKALVRNLFARRLPDTREPPPTFFERAAAAGWVALVSPFPAVVAVMVAALGLEGLGLLVQELQKISLVAVPAILIFVGVSALAYAVMQPWRPLWRLVDLDHQPARRLARILSRIALVYAADVVAQEVIRRLYLPVSISIAETAVASIALAVLLLELVRTPFDPMPRAPGSDPSKTQGVVLAESSAPGARPSRLSPYLIKLPILAIAVAILVLSLAGYIGLGRFLATQVVVTGSALALVLILHMGVRAVLGGPTAEVTPFETLLQTRTGLDPAQSATIARALAVALNGVLVLLAVPLILITWGYSPPEALAWLKSAVFGFEIGQFKISFARIFIAVLLFLALLFATRIVQRWLDMGLLTSQRMDRGISNSIHTAVGYAGFLIALLVAVSYGGLDITNFAIVAGALSVGIGFGLQSIVNNFVSGLILLAERPIKVGDWVSVKGQEGFVRRISVRSTEIETPDRASLIVPNSELVSSSVTNWSHRNALGRVLVKVGVSYKSDAEHVSSVLQKVASESTMLMQHPAPGVSFDNFGPNALEFSVSGIVSDFTKAGAAQTDLRMRILKAFRAEGIEMPFAQHDVHLRDLDLVRQILARVIEERAARSGRAPSPDDKRDG